MDLCLRPPSLHLPSYTVQIFVSWWSKIIIIHKNAFDHPPFTFPPTLRKSVPFGEYHCHFYHFPHHRLYFQAHSSIITIMKHYFHQISTAFVKPKQNMCNKCHHHNQISASFQTHIIMKHHQNHKISTTFQAHTNDDTATDCNAFSFEVTFIILTIIFILRMVWAAQQWTWPHYLDHNFHYPHPSHHHHHHERIAWAAQQWTWLHYLDHDFHYPHPSHHLHHHVKDGLGCTTVNLTYLEEQQPSDTEWPQVGIVIITLSSFEEDYHNHRHIISILVEDNIQNVHLLSYLVLKWPQVGIVIITSSSIVEENIQNIHL